MKIIEKYLTTNVGAFEGAIEKNTARLNELMEQHKQIQIEYTNLENSNKFLAELIADIKEQFKQEGETNVATTTETN